MTLVALGRKLQERGHRFTLFALSDLAKLAEKHGITFQELDNSPGYLPSRETFLQDVAQTYLSYRDLLKYGLGEIALYCEQAPQAMEKAGVECLIADQLVIPARTVAQRINVPHISICSAVPLRTDPDVPPSSRPWPYSRGRWPRLRNRLSYGLLAMLSRPFSKKLNNYRRQWGMVPHRKIDDTFSTLAQITQLVREFDFDFETQLPHQYYVGPFQREDYLETDFPYERLDGRPLIYASLGTLIPSTVGVWTTIAKSCVGLDAQLVISLGGKGRIGDYSDLPGRPLVVRFAPQRELLKRVTVMIAHGGLNSVMESLSQGVPLISLHAASGDQPGIAMRIVASGVGEVLPMGRLRTDSLRPLVKRVLTDPRYRTQAAVMREAIQKTRGSEQAAEIVELVSCRTEGARLDKVRA